jgi:hypothetical protein
MKAYFRWIENVLATGTDHTSSNIISRDKATDVRVHKSAHLFLIRVNCVYFLLIEDDQLI